MKPLQGDTLSSKDGTGHALGEIDSVTRHGTVIYKALDGAIRDDGTCLEIAQGSHGKALEMALQMAVERFGPKLSVNGSDAFKERIVQAAAAAPFKVTFSDPELEAQRISILAVRETSEAAAIKYVNERNAKRAGISDIAEHRVFQPSDAGIFSFGGLRQVEGEYLVLLRDDNTILVRPVSAEEAFRLKRLHLGEMLSVTANGAVERKGRGR